MEENSINAEDALTSIVSYLNFVKSLGVKGFDTDSELNDLVKNLDKVSFEKKPVNNICNDCILPTHIIDGEGSLNTDVVFVLETPEMISEKDSEAFLLLKNMLKSINLSIDDVYITSLIKCKVPEYIIPSKTEFDNCRNSFDLEIKEISPKIICSLGSGATRVMMGKKGTVADIRGHFIEFGRSTLFPTFSPSFLLKNPAFKKEAWMDLKKLQAKLTEIS